MDPYVACDAVLIPRVGHVVRRALNPDSISLPSEVSRSVVTFQAEREHRGAAQQTRIRRPVRIVADFAPLNPQGCSPVEVAWAMRGRSPIRHDGEAAPCGLWQSVHATEPSFTRCLYGIENWARTLVWQP
jgi:hypothetical protein